MTNVRGAHAHGRVPEDTFAVRIAIVRAEMGWNYDQAARATGIGSETWRLWEKRKRQCTTLDQTCRRIAESTGFSYEWLMVGGPLAPPDPFTGASRTERTGAVIDLAPTANSGWRYRTRHSGPRSLARLRAHAAA